MDIDSLRVVHLPKKQLVKRNPALGYAFCLDSCLRWLWILTEEPTDLTESVEIYRGAAAYEFLLRVATGLESEVIGETDIFGQLKKAWDLDPRPELRLAVQWLFEDTKEIRSRFLQNLGGYSYGSLVRRLIRDRFETVEGPVLLLGAGQLAQSVAPYLIPENGEALWVWNRRGLEIPGLPADRVRNLGPETVAEAGWREARHVVLCVPARTEHDLHWISLWQQRITERGLLIHLGGLREQCGTWSSRGLRGFHCLDDLFAIQRRQDEIRSTQVVRAERACAERAKLRCLGGSLSIAHGWEDLATFV